MTTQSRSKVAPLGFIWALALGAVASNAQDDPEEVVVYGITPSQGAALPAEQIPYHVQAVDAEELRRAQSLSLADYLNRNLGSVSLNDAQNNPLQPDLQYRGFTASPLLGLAQGIAVYQNGVRINEPLGDTVNWDLVPESAIHRVSLVGGTNPVFGLNTLGGALAIEMKNGFNTSGHEVKISGGSFDRVTASAQTSGRQGNWGYYLNANYFDEDGWRDESESDALNLYGSVGWQGAATSVNLNLQRADSELLGNGAVPVELLALDREAIFTAPDRTENDLTMFSLDGSYEASEAVTLTGTAFYRKNETDSFNGDASEFAECDLGGLDRLLEGLEEDDLEDIGLDDDDVCDGQFADAQALEDFLNTTAAGLGEDEEFDLDDLTDELSGTGVLADDAINNVSDREQDSFGTDLQAIIRGALGGRPNQFVVGIGYIDGESTFNSITELSELDPSTRSTQGLGTGTFVDELETMVDTATRTLSVYFVNTLELTPKATLTVAGRFNDTDVSLQDLSGERPELNGDHNFSRFNPAIGLTYQATDNVNLYASYSESNRAPTPIELACNDEIFDLAVANAIAQGEDPDDVEFECRLPNAFLADPPLDDVVSKGVEAGVRGVAGATGYHVGLFHLTNNDDILFQTTGRATGLFANVDETRRAGVELALHGNYERFDWFFNYTYLDATFEDDFAVLSPNHPFADDDGQIQVSSGDRIPGLSENTLKVGGDWRIAEALSLGIDVVYNSDQVLRGDESNQVDTLEGYTVVDLRGAWQVTDNFEVFARVSNLFDEDYETFGLLGEEPSEVEVPLFEDFENPRFVGPAAPRAVFVGFRLRAE